MRERFGMLTGVERAGPGRRLRLHRPRGQARRRGARGRLDHRHVLRGRLRPAHGGPRRRRPRAVRRRVEDLPDRAALRPERRRDGRRHRHRPLGEGARSCRSWTTSSPRPPASSTPWPSCATTSAPGWPAPRRCSRARRPATSWSSTCSRSSRCRCRRTWSSARSSGATRPSSRSCSRPAWTGTRSCPISGVENREAYDADQRKTVEEAVRTQFILDAIADAREVTVDNDDLSAQIMAQAQRSRMSPEQYAQQLQQGGNIAEFVADVRRTKALAQLLEQTTITDASGNVVDLEALRPKTVQAADDAEADDEAADDDAAEADADEADRGRRPTTPRPDPQPEPHRRRRPTRPGWGGVVRFRRADVAAPSANTAPTGTGRRRSALGSTGLRRSPGGAASRRAVPARTTAPAHRDRLHRQSYGGHRTREHYPPEPGERADAARRRRNDEPRRLGLRAAAARADHLPGHPGRRRHRQPAARADAAAVRRGPRAATSTSTSTRPAARSPPAWRSTTRCSSSTCDVATYGMGLAASMGQFLLTAGTKGKRYALPHARILMHQPLGRRRRHARPTSPSRPSSSAVTKKEMTELIAAAHRPDARADRDRLRPRPLVHRAGGPGVRLRRPHHQPAPAMTDSTNPVTDN